MRYALPILPLIVAAWLAMSPAPQPLIRSGLLIGWEPQARTNLLRYANPSFQHTARFTDPRIGPVDMTVTLPGGPDETVSVSPR